MEPSVTSAPTPVPPPSRPSTIAFAKVVRLSEPEPHIQEERQQIQEQVILDQIPSEEVILQFRGYGGGRENQNNIQGTLGESALGIRALDTFSQLYYSSALSDVTLVVDGSLVKAHKIVLSISSPYFRTIFEEISALPCPHFHPIVAVRGVSLKEWEILRCLLYQGAVRVSRGDLEALLAAAEVFQIENIETLPCSPTPPTFIPQNQGTREKETIENPAVPFQHIQKHSHPQRSKNSHHSSRHPYELEMAPFPESQSISRCDRYIDVEEDAMDYDISRDESTRSPPPPPEVRETPPANTTFRLQLSPQQCGGGGAMTTTSRSQERESHDYVHPLRIRSLSTSPVASSPMSGTVPHCLRYSTQEVNNMIRAVEHLPGNLVPCAICRKNVKRERLRPHINECHLLDGKRIFCPLCCVAFKSKGSYRVHIWRHRRGTAGGKF